MSEQIHEQISALLDGELPIAELSLLIKQISAQPALLKQAQGMQQTRLCLQGEQPAFSSSDAFLFSSKIQNAIRDESECPTYDQAQENLEYQAPLLSVNNSKIAANDPGRWRPLFGAGVAAAVAMFAVTAWQSQSSVEQEISGLKTPLIAETEKNSNFNFGDSGPQGNLKLNAGSISIDASTNINPVGSTLESNTGSYTVPVFSTLNTVDSTFVQSDDLHQVKYSSYLLQNQVAPRNTSTDLYRDAQQFRVRALPQFFVDQRTGKVFMSIKPIESN